ncbi:MAG TPA: insulinase family protein, partial [bacterium]|nr:insulinase family protein [bacterium]
LAASVINVRAGSHTETIPVNGISHLLEHLLFDGTATRTAAEITGDVENRGGYINAFTRKDYVSFEVVMPSAEFMTGLEVQADQLLNSTIPESELPRERSVVCEEIATDIRNASSAADDILWETLFGPSGYGLPVIGNYQTVTDVSRERIINFYKSRYVPNRMTAIIVGDVDPQPVLEKLTALYGGVPAGLENPGPGPLPEFPPDGVMKVVSRPVKSSAVTLAFAAPGPDDPAFRLFNLAVSLWADSPESPLQKALEPHATRVAAYVSPHRGFSLLQIVATPAGSESAMPGSDDSPEPEPEPETILHAMETAVLESIRTFMASPRTESEVAPLIRSARVDHEFARERFHHLARDIGEHAALGTLDRYWNFDRELDEIRLDGVMAAFGMWMADARPVSVLVTPGTMSEEPVGSLDMPRVARLSNGMTVIAQFDAYADMAAIHLLTPNPGGVPDGVPRIVAEMLDAGTLEMTAAELESALNRRGIRTKLADWAWLPFDDYYDSIEYNYFRMECLAGDLDTALDLMGQMAFRSTFPETQWERVSRSMAMLAGRSAGSSSAVSGLGLRQAMFQDAYHGRSRLPQMTDLPQITPEMLREYHARAYRPEAC